MFSRSRKRKRIRDAGSGSSSSYDRLEQRLPLTTFLVTTSTDSASSVPDGVISLREAVIAANFNQAYGDAPAGQSAGDIIRFDSDVMSIDLTAGDIAIADDLLIQGGAGVDIRGDGDSRIFTVTSSQRVGFGNLYLTGGRADQGGAIKTSGTGTTILKSMTFVGNRALAEDPIDHGGGAVLQEGGRLTVIDSRFSGNSAYGFASVGDGGAIRTITGIANIQDSTFTNNYVSRNGGAISILDGTLISSGVKFGVGNNGNKTGSFGTTPGSGGAAHLEGESTARFDGNEFRRNWGSQDGGAIWLSNQSNVSVIDSQFAGNYANVGGEGLGGGAIFNDGGQLFVTNGTFQYNASNGGDGDGGAIYVDGGFARIAGSSLLNNNADRSGGAIFVDSAQLTVDTSVLQQNRAGLTGAATPGTGNGGAIFATGKIGTVRVISSDLIDNRAAVNGGAMWSNSATKTIVDSSTYSNNKALGTDAENGGGAIFIDGAEFTIDETSFQNNIANKGGAVLLNGGTVRGERITYSENTAHQHGGGMAIVEGGTARLFYTEAVGNMAGASSAVVGQGGAVFVGGVDSRVIFYFSSQFEENVADLGGGLAVGEGAAVRARNGNDFLNNEARADGGAIYSSGFVFVDATMIGNRADRSGGGLYVAEGGSARVASRNIIGNNHAEQFGGAILNDGYLHLLDGFFENDGFFTDNSAGLNGDFLHTTSTGVTFQSS